MCLLNNVPHFPPFIPQYKPQSLNLQAIGCKIGHNPSPSQFPVHWQLRLPVQNCCLFPAPDYRSAAPLHCCSFCCSQLTPVGTTIFQGVHAKDVDAGVNGLVEYFIVPGDGKGLGTDDGVGRNRINVADGVGYFSINLPHQGQVTVNRSLDFERTQRYLVTIVASVRTTVLLCYKSM